MDLSGRVENLEKQLLIVPKKADWDALTRLINSGFNSITDEMNQLNDRFNDINRKVVNLQLFGVTGSTSGNHNHIINEVPAGSINGTNAVFVLQSIPVPQSSLCVYKNGLLQKQGNGNDYILTSSTITFEAGSEPVAGSNLLASYTV